MVVEPQTLLAEKNNKNNNNNNSNRYNRVPRASLLGPLKINVHHIFST
uniref:Uncharacterized protein n=1 Tax=Anguilla anguilla TaxID=7936 RepID=A0A0E9W6P8_ANGAN